MMGGHQKFSAWVHQVLSKVPASAEDPLDPDALTWEDESLQSGLDPPFMMKAPLDPPMLVMWKSLVSQDL